MLRPCASGALCINEGCSIRKQLWLYTVLFKTAQFVVSKFSTCLLTEVTSMAFLGFHCLTEAIEVAIWIHKIKKCVVQKLYCFEITLTGTNPPAS